MTDKPRLNAQKQYQRPHVLIVADDPSLASFLNEGLPLGGFWTSVIASGLQAIEVFRLRQFDIVLVDAGLSSFDAMEFIRRLRGMSSRATTGEARTTAPIVVVSEQENSIPDAAAHDLGIEATFTPPIELDDMVRTLHAVFGDWQERYPDIPLADFRSSMRD